MRNSPATLSLALSLCLLPGLASGAEKEQPPAPAAKQANPVASAPRRNTGGPGDYGLREKLVKRLNGEPDLGRGLRIVMVNGGAVFSAGSINYVASLPVDDRVSQITANVFRKFLL